MNRKYFNITLLLNKLILYEALSQIPMYLISQKLKVCNYALINAIYVREYRRKSTCTLDNNIISVLDFFYDFDNCVNRRNASWLFQK